MNASEYGEDWKQQDITDKIDHISFRTCLKYLTGFR